MTTETNAEPTTQASATSASNPLAGGNAGGASNSGSSTTAGDADSGSNSAVSAGSDPTSTTGGDSESTQGTTGLDWAGIRDKVANGDEKVLKRLSRYSTMESAVEALIAAQNKIASGQLKSALPEGATPEQLAAWRAENGIPEKVTDYNITLPEDFEFAEGGEKAMEGLLNRVHELNLNPAQAQSIFDYIVEQQQADASAMADRLAAFESEQVEALREMWGGDYKLNSNIVMNLLDSAPAGVKDMLLSATMANGAPLAHSAEMMRWLADLSREINPVATVVPGSGEQAMKTIQAEKASLEAMMGDPNSAYNKGPNRHKLQDRYMELVSAEQRATR